MVTNHIIGGYKHGSGWGTDELFELTCPALTPESCTFERVSTRLWFARDGHIALPITDEFAYQFCDHFKSKI